ncbi:single-stranded DNA-binding protein [Priestia aryabhattai]|uniref:single-stranded DNA-binding protein n=1 Tax=Priestia aryabhattai TaxID=412384 RepID=UPI003A80102E
MINHIVLVGRLTKKPELRYTHEGIAVSTITLAINRTFQNVEGEYDADFVNITLWRKNAENTAAYCDKGAVVGVVGRVQTRTFENNLQQRVYMTDVVADAVKFLSGKPSDSSSFGSNQQEE